MLRPPATVLLLSIVAASSVAVPSVAVSSDGTLAQLTTTPGPGGIPIAPGAPVRGYTPGGIGPGGGRVAPGPAAGDVPMYRQGPGGVPVQVRPRREEPRTSSPTRASRTAPAADCGSAACLPDSLRLTVTARADDGDPPPPRAIDSTGDLAAALRACWTPPPEERARSGMEMTVRFGLRRDGTVMGTPRVTYATRGVPAETRDAYRAAVTRGLERCDRLTLSERFGKALAGRPLVVRYVDARRERPRDGR
ncbi:MAG: hypothetical protein HZA68_16175 [Rhodovulum sp.]|nr:hypothetical protein [Rhodovulum sp.]